MNKFIAIVTLLFSSMAAATNYIDLNDVNNNLDQQGEYVNSISEQEASWNAYNKPDVTTGGGDLDASVDVRGWVVLNKEKGLVKQWGRIDLPHDSLGQHRVAFPRVMREVFTINVTSTDPYTSSSCRNCTMETDARVKGFNQSGFDVTHGYVGDSKGGVYNATFYWEAIGKI